MKEFKCEDCGKTYKHAASLYKHQRRHRHGKFASIQGDGESRPSDTVISSGPSIAEDDNSPPHLEGSNEGLEDAAERGGTFEEPGDEHPGATYAWQSFEVEMDDATAPIPGVLKGLKRHGKGKKVSNMTGAERDSQKRLIGIAYRGIDGILEKYGQAVIENETFEISRSQSDYDWVSTLTLDMCEEQGWSGIPISATGLWVIGSGYWVGKPITEIQRKRTKPLGKGKGFLSRLPLVGRFIKKRKDRKVKDMINDITVEGGVDGED